MRFYEHLTEGLTYSDALRQTGAMRLTAWLRGWDPSVWAFVLSGG